MTKPIHIKVPKFWASSMMPEGIMEKWLQPNGSRVKTDDPIAAIRIEGMLHMLPAPCTGTLQATCKVNSIVDPGFVIGRVLTALDA